MSMRSIMTRRLFVPGRAHSTVSVRMTGDQVRSALRAVTRFANKSMLGYYYSVDGQKLVGYIDSEIHITTSGSFVNPNRSWVRADVMDDGQGVVRLDMRSVYPPVSCLWFAMTSLMATVAGVGSLLDSSWVLFAVSAALIAGLVGVSAFERHRYRVVVAAVLAAVGAEHSSGVAGGRAG